MYAEQEKLSNMEYSILLRKHLLFFCELLESDKSTIHLPVLKGRWTKRSGSFFHLSSEIFLQLSGSCYFEFPQQQLVINPRDIVIVPPGLPHKETVLPRGQEPFSNLVYMVGEEGASVHLAGCRRRTADAVISDLPYPIYLEALPVRRFYKSMTGIMEEIPSDRSDESRNLRRHLFHSLLLQTLLDLGAPTDKASFIPVGDYPQGNRKHYRVGVAQRMIQEHIMGPMPLVSDLAAAVKCSPNHLSTLFHDVVGVTIKEYINALKLDYARRIIETTTYNISEIAWSCGYHDTPYFTKIFRRRFGFSPVELRRGKGSNVE